MIPVRSIGQCVQLGLGVGRNCARLGRGVAVRGGWWRTGGIDGRKRALLGDTGGVGVWVVWVGKEASMIADVSVDLIFDVRVAARGLVRMRWKSWSRIRCRRGRGCVFPSVTDLDRKGEDSGVCRRLDWREASAF